MADAAVSPDPFDTAGTPAGARRLGGLAGPVPRGRQRRGGPRPRRLPRPAAGRARARTPRTPRSAPGCRGGCAWSCPATSLRGRRTPARRWTPPACRAWPRCGPRPSATRRAPSAASASASPPSWRSATSRPCSRRRRGRGSARTARAAEVAAVPASPTSWPGATAPSRCCACRGRPSGAPPDGFDHRGACCPLRAGARPAVATRWPAFGGDVLLGLPGLAAIEVGRRRRRGRCTREAAPDGAVTDGGPDRLAGGAALRRAGRRAARRPAGRGALPARLDRDLGGAARRRRRPGRCRPEQVVHAPTPSDEPLSLPVRLIAPFPLGPDRRHVAPGPVTDALVDARRRQLRRAARRPAAPTRRCWRSCPGRSWPAPRWTPARRRGPGRAADDGLAAASRTTPARGRAPSAPPSLDDATERAGRRASPACCPACSPRAGPGGPTPRR